MDKYKLFLLTVLVIVIIWSGIHPPSQSYWLLENSPIFVAILTFFLFSRFIKLSNFSYTLIVIYLIFPLITSRYGLTGVPFGQIIGEWMGTTRNMYDRLTHFAFGFMGFYPVLEFVNYATKKEGWWNYYTAFATIVALGAIYEIFEWLAFLTVNPALGNTFFGAQGDIFDTQKDMVMNTIGAIIALVIAVIAWRNNQQKLSKI